MSNAAALLAEELVAARGPARRALLARVAAAPGVLGELKRRVDARRGQNAREAIRIARIALSAGRAAGGVGERAIGEHALANALHGASRHADALGHYQLAIAGYRRVGLDAERRRAELSSIDVLFRLGRGAAADALARRLEREYRRAGEPAGAAKVLVNLANVRHQQDRHLEAVRLLERARPALVAADERLVLAHVALDLANSCSLLARFERSAELYAEARELYAALGRRVQVAVVDYNQAYDAFLQCRIHDARRQLSRALAVFREEGVGHALALAALDQAEMALALGLPRRAIEAAEEARAAFTAEHAPVEAARATLRLAEATRLVGEPDRAAELLREARAAFARCHHGGGLAAVDLALASSPALPARRRMERARSAAAAFAGRRMRGREAVARALAGTIALEQGQLPEARSWLGGALRQARRLGLGEVEVRAQHALARLDESSGRPERALERYRAATSAYERLRAALGSDEDRLAFATDKARVFEDAVRVALDLGQLQEAFQFVERVRSRALVDLLGADPRFGAAAARRGGRLGLRLVALKKKLSGLEARARDQERRTAGLTPALAREIRSVVESHEEALARVARVSPEASFASDGRPIASLEQIRALLGSERALVVWFEEGSRLGALVVTEREVRAWRGIAARSDIERALAALRFSLGSARLDPARTEIHREALVGTALAALEALHRLLIAPLEAALGERALVVVPTAALHVVPFHALTRGGRALIEGREVSVAPSATVLVGAARRRPRTRAALVLACADAAAPLIASEGRAVAARLGARLHEGIGATAEALRREAGSARVLHIAAHGVFEPGEPLLSGLELGDGRLTLPEIAGLPLDAALVVLSACETAVGSPRGDEVQGLVRSFLHAGARSVVASLWAVNDASTESLMATFYRELGAGRGVAASLRQAVLALKSERPHPFFWAPFQVVGCWDAVYSETRRFSPRGVGI